MTVCSICGNRAFHDIPVLWPALIQAWELAPHEVAYIDLQQGRHCTRCRANLRSIALASALLRAFRTDRLLADFVRSDAARPFRILEINEAGTLSATLRQMPGHRLVRYPDVDMHAMPFAGGSFDIVVHSDTLEHVADPLRALSECRRILASGGALCFTVPIVVGRMTRSRAGLPKSYHGDPGADPEDYLVHTEFGVDAWTMAMQAGFAHLAIDAVEFPAALAITARREGDAVAIRAARERERETAARIAGLERRLHALETSTSWRLTAPLRAGVRRLRNLRG